MSARDSGAAYETREKDRPLDEIVYEDYGTVGWLVGLYITHTFTECICTLLQASKSVGRRWKFRIEPFKKKVAEGLVN